MSWNLKNTYSQLPEALYVNQKPIPVKNPSLVLLNNGLALDLGLDIEELRSSEGTAILAGNAIPQDSQPIAQAYAGHQFGYFTMLGDGRAVLLGEQLTPAGKVFDIQLKGSGRTPFSRRGDGRAALGPMLREYLISEAMFALGIPSTRSLAVVTTGEQVYRETPLQGAILTRCAASHIRIGTFQYAAAKKDLKQLKELADYSIKRHYPELLQTNQPYLGLLDSVTKRLISLINQWLRVGFVHGVMNTDNMAISGETIDYGPCAFIDHYDPKAVFSSIDHHGRYAFGEQADIAHWNLARFAETLLPLLSENSTTALALANDCLKSYTELFEKEWLQMMGKKLGIFSTSENDKSFFDELLKIMHEHKLDYTNTFRLFTRNNHKEILEEKYLPLSAWIEKWRLRQAQQNITSEQAASLMKKNNPVIIPRNHLVEAALQATKENMNLGPILEFLEVLKAPYLERQDSEKYIQSPNSDNAPYKTFCGT
ncbi:MAG: YdiU family protein [Oligoflexales bacterium]|nr:YdiU family protein [Oligoflexales bacterium]